MIFVNTDIIYYFFSHSKNNLIINICSHYERHLMELKTRITELKNKTLVGIFMTEYRQQNYIYSLAKDKNLQHQKHQ